MATFACGAPLDSDCQGVVAGVVYSGDYTHANDSRATERFRAIDAYGIATGTIGEASSRNTQ